MRWVKHDTEGNRLPGDYEMQQDGPGEWVESVDTAFIQQQLAKHAEINERFELEASALIAGYPDSERMTWAIQQTEALAWSRDSATPTPYLDGVAVARGIDPLDMRQKTVAQVQLFMGASQALVGKRQRLRDAIDAIQDGPDAATQLAAVHWEE